MSATSSLEPAGLWHTAGPGSLTSQKAPETKKNLHRRCKVQREGTIAGKLLADSVSPSASRERKKCPAAKSATGLFSLSASAESDEGGRPRGFRHQLPEANWEEEKPPARRQQEERGADTQTHISPL